MGILREIHNQREKRAEEIRNALEKWIRPMEDRIIDIENYYKERAKKVMYYLDRRVENGNSKKDI